MEKYTSLKNAENQYPNLTFMPHLTKGRKWKFKRLAYLLRTKLPVYVCAHKNEKPYSCGCTYGCGLCGASYCPDCDNYLKNSIPYAFVGKEQERLVLDSLYTLQENLKLLNEMGE